MPTLGTISRKETTKVRERYAHLTHGMVSLDTETTGKDLYHGSRPFFVTMWDGKTETPDYWEWEVDPLTRRPLIPEGDLRDLRGIFESRRVWEGERGSEEDVLILQNPKFDVRALATIGIDGFPWGQVRDTLTAGHLLNTKMPHNLTDMTCHYLGVDIEPLEKEAEKIVQECRRLCRSKFPDWRIAKDGYEDMPSVKKNSGKEKEDKSWKADMWLPRALAIELDLPDEHPWWHVLANYANADSMVTHSLWITLRERLRSEGLWDIFAKARNKLPQLTFGLESRGVTCSKKSMDHMARTYLEESHENGEICRNIARSYNFNLSLPKGASPNKSVRDFVLNVLGLEKIYKENAKSDEPTLDKAALAYYLHSLEPGTKEHLFIKSLLGKRARDKALTDLAGYRRFWVPVNRDVREREGEWYRLHPNLNPCGTDTLRWSCRNPNGQNIKQEEATDVDEMSIREIFGPLPGREWWACDGKNLERRIPAYEANEEDIIYLFERPDEPPYFGSEHLMVAHMIFPREFERCRDSRGNLDGRLFKEHYLSLYKRTKNGNFSIQYNAGKRKADATFGVSGAFDLIKSRFHRQETLNQKCIRTAERLGYVETIPDRTVDPERGYPIGCAREYGRVKPTLPFNYHTQGTACWWMMMCMIRVEEKLAQWRREGFDAYLIMQVHDELLFDFPKATHPRTSPEESNLWRVQELKKLMEVNGQNLVVPIPTPVSIVYYDVNWTGGYTCA